jgi:probable F420-dependent oxidoreductase
MKFGIGLFWGGMEPEMLADVARRADELGYDAVFIWEHLVYPEEIRSRYPYSPDGTAPFADSRTLDPWVVMGHIAAVTSRIRLGTNIYILPLRNPFVTARAVLTVDALSKGRVMLGAAVGWLKEEFDLVGEDFHNRGPRTDELVQVLKVLWTQEKPEFHGRFYDFGPVRFDPKPVQKPHPPIIFGGETDLAMRRAARLGDGWISAGAIETAETARQKIEKLRALRREASREGEPFDVTMLAGPVPDPVTVRRLEEVGVTRLLVAPWYSPELMAEAARVGTSAAMARQRATLDLMSEGLERYADQVLSRQG